MESPTRQDLSISIKENVQHLNTKILSLPDTLTSRLKKYQLIYLCSSLAVAVIFLSFFILFGTSLILKLITVFIAVVFLVPMGHLYKFLVLYPIADYHANVKQSSAEHLFFSWKKNLPIFTPSFCKIVIFALTPCA